MGLGNNPLAGKGNEDKVIRNTIREQEEKITSRTSKKKSKVISFSLEENLTERLRQFAFDERCSKSAIVREALHNYLADRGY